MKKAEGKLEVLKKEELKIIAGGKDEVTCYCFYQSTSGKTILGASWRAKDGKYCLDACHSLGRNGSYKEESQEDYEKNLDEYRKLTDCDWDPPNPDPRNFDA